MYSVPGNAIEPLIFNSKLNRSGKAMILFGRVMKAAEKKLRVESADSKAKPSPFQDFFSAFWRSCG